MSSGNHSVSKERLYEAGVIASSVHVLSNTDAKVTKFSAEAQPSRVTVPQTGRRKFNQVLQLYIVTDMTALVLGFFCAWGMTTAINGTNAYDTSKLLGFLTIATGCLLWFQNKGHYNVRMNFWAELQNVLGTLGFAMMVDGFFQFATKQDFSRMWLMSGWIFAAVGIILLRGLLRGRLRKQGVWQVRTLLVGNGHTAKDTRAALKSEARLGFEITAQIKNLPETFMQAGRSWERLCKQYGVDYVIIALDGLDLEKAEQSIAQLVRESVPFSISPPRRHLPMDMVPQYFFNYDVKLLTHNSGLEQPMPRFIKRMFDIVVSGLLLLILSPVILVIAAMTKLEGDPVFFGHLRLGKNGKPFSCWKFRSMMPGSEAILQRYLAENPEAKAEWEATQKLKNDPRVTRLGNFLRRTSLDELPQLVNVLRGDMSLVGPRPIVIAEVPKYDHDIAHYYRVSPGITGLWQVSGRNDVTYEQRVQMDSWYVRNWSLWHDIAILCKTIPALMNRQGAY